MKDRVFSILHLSLIPIKQPSFETYRGTREDWLRYALRETFQFVGWGGKNLVWVPKGNRDGFIFGLIQGTKLHSFHEPPNKGGAEVEDEFWQGAFVFLDPTHHDDGQKLAIENDVLGRPLSLSKALFDHLNGRGDSPYVCVPELVFNADDFWKFSDQSNGVLSYIRFEFVVPNMWGPQNDLEKDLRDTGKQTGSERVDVTFRGRGGVRTDNEKVKTAVEYAGRGAGVVKAKNMHGEKFSSEKQATQESVSRELLDAPSQDTLESVARQVLKRV